MQQEVPRYAVGLDIGTNNVKCVIGHMEAGSSVPSVIGIGVGANNGMRKGTVVNLVNTAQAIDKALESAERMSGHQVTGATVSVNGTHVVGMSSQGVVAVAVNGHEIDDSDIERVQEAATVVQLPANRQILEVTPRSYQLDGQENIKDPIGMMGVRLEVDAHVITALTPHLKNLSKACEMAEIHTNATVLSGIAAARAVLSEQQMEHGVVLIDLGGTTTNVVVFEEGDLQHVAVLPVGSANITNDLAIGLKTDLDIAEAVKLECAVAVAAVRKNDGPQTVKIDGKIHKFESEEIDMIVDARLEEIFELITKELKSIGRAAKLPGGVVLTGGGAKLKGIDEYAKKALQLSARIGKPRGLGGVAEQIELPEFAVATGLMLTDLESFANSPAKTKKVSGGVNVSITKMTQKITGVMNKFRV